MLGIAQKGLAAGMNVVRMNQRNCGGTNALAPTLYHSGRSAGHCRSGKRNVIERDHVSRLALVAIPWAATSSSSWLANGAIGGPREFRAVAAVCPSMDLAASADALHAPSNRLYESYFLWNLRRRLREKARLFPTAFDPARLRGVKSLREFDDKITAFYCGFQGAEDYYTRSSASNVVDRIAVPAFILQSANDPFIRIRPETRQKLLANPNIRFVETDDGGHCSFVAERNGLDDEKNDGHWAEWQVTEFLRQFTIG